MEEPYEWHARLLRARRQRPRGSRAAEQRDELAPFYLTELHLTLDEPGLRRKVYPTDEVQSGGGRTILHRLVAAEHGQKRALPLSLVRKPDVA